MESGRQYRKIRSRSHHVGKITPDADNGVQTDTVALKHPDLDKSEDAIRDGADCKHEIPPVETECEFNPDVKSEIKHDECGRKSICKPNPNINDEDLSHTSMGDSEDFQSFASTSVDSRECSQTTAQRGDVIATFSNSQCAPTAPSSAPDVMPSWPWINPPPDIKFHRNLCVILRFQRNRNRAKPNRCLRKYNSG